MTKTTQKAQTFIDQIDALFPETEPEPYHDREPFPQITGKKRQLEDLIFQFTERLPLSTHTDPTTDPDYNPDHGFATISVPPIGPYRNISLLIAPYEDYFDISINYHDLIIDAGPIQPGEGDLPVIALLEHFLGALWKKHYEGLLQYHDIQTPNPHLPLYTCKNNIDDDNIDDDNIDDFMTVWRNAMEAVLNSSIEIAPRETSEESTENA